MDEAEECTPSRLHQPFIALIRRRHGLRSAVDMDSMFSMSRAYGFGYGEAVLIRSTGRADSEAELAGARELLDRWPASPRVWVVP